MKLRTHHPGDKEEIKQLFTRTFSDSEGPSEGLLIGNLACDLLTSTDPQDYYCYVATENEQIAGCIIFSRLTFESDVNAFFLAPVAVHTSCQGKGTG